MDLQFFCQTLDKYSVTIRTVAQPSNSFLNMRAGIDNLENARVIISIGFKAIRTEPDFIEA